MSTHFFHFLCNRLIIRYAFLCFLYLYIAIGAMDKDRVCVETPIFLFVYCIPFFFISVECNTFKMVKIRKCSFLNANYTIRDRDRPEVIVAHITYPFDGRYSLIKGKTCVF